MPPVTTLELGTGARRSTRATPGLRAGLQVLPEFLRHGSSLLLAPANHESEGVVPCNVFSIIARVRKALQRISQDARARELVERAFSASSYDEVLQLCFEYVEVS